MSRSACRLGLVALLALSAPALAAEPKVPEGFEVRLVASVPAVQYPCQVATAPGDQLFVAEDPMDQVGPYESKNGRILLFKGDADPVPFADGFRAVQGMAWRDGSLYVCHMPFLTVLSDTDGDGKSDSREDLFQDLGPTNNQGLNDHIVSGLQFGVDGWLYISVGDKGIPKATGPDGRTIQIKGGGCVRCRPDGTGIEVVSTGTRNHLEVNLDDRDNIFTYDNTDDGLGWWTRVTHHIDGGYYGYAYDYQKRPDRFLDRMAEYGGGSPCGAVVYKEDAWPETWRNVGFWAEWGKGKVQAIRFKPKGASYEVAEMIDFAEADGVDNFRPIDLAISDDGRTMYVADWGMGGWGSKTEKVGRVWAITHKDAKPRPRGTDADTIAGQIDALGHPSFSERTRAQRALVRMGKDAIEPVTAALAEPGRAPAARRHLLWVLDELAGSTPTATTPTLELFKSPVAELRAQAARAMGLRSAAIAVDGLQDLLRDPEPSVRLQALIALGRLGQPASIEVVAPFVADDDPYLAFAARSALRRINEWKTVATTGLTHGSPKVRLGLLSAMDEQYDKDAVEALVGHATSRDRPSDERAAALRFAASVHRKAEPWDGSWWGTRPAAGEPPAKVVDWEGTSAVVAAVRAAVTDPAAPVRMAAAAAIVELKDAESLPSLRRRFAEETDDGTKKELARAFGSLKDQDSLPLLASTLKDANAPDAVREAALSAVEAIGTSEGAAALVDLLRSGGLPEDRVPKVLAALGKFAVPSSLEAVMGMLDSADPKVRAASAEAAAKIGPDETVGPKVRPMLADSSIDARKAAIAALAAIKDREAVPALLALAESEDTRFEAATALAAIPDMRAFPVYLRGLADRSADLRRNSASAVAALKDEAAPVLEALHQRRELPSAAVPELARIFTGVQPILSWRIAGPFPIADVPPFAVEGPIDLAATFHGGEGKPIRWRERKTRNPQGRVDFERVYPNAGGEKAAYAYAEIKSPTARKAAVVAGSDDTLSVWVNGKVSYEFHENRGYDPAAARFDVDLEAGTNRILVKSGNHGGQWVFSLALSDPAEYGFLKGAPSESFSAEVYRDFAMDQAGSAEKGRALFADPKGLACAKCHAVKGEGGAVGPDLSDLAVKYPKNEIIESVLYPSAKIFSGYEPVVVALNDGRVLTGIVKNETADAIEIVDAEAKVEKIAKADIEERKAGTVSLMPSGLAEGLTKEDFADLISYLETLKDKPAAKP